MRRASSSIGRWRSAWFLCALACAASAGCALPAFIHDKAIGPISPAGHVHSTTVGGEFTVTDEGVRTINNGEWWFRPFPADILQRIGRPRSFWFAAKGFHAFFYGLSPVVMRDLERGVPLEGEKLEAVSKAKPHAREVLERLGPPQRWIRRRTGSIMAYRADQGRLIALWLGTPPFVDIIPGANNFSFRYLYRRNRPFKTVLFFDADDRLRGLVDNHARMRGEEDQEVEE